jgi:uncharacterized membrane protein HdeD (DUF308 family)
MSEEKLPFSALIIDIIIGLIAIGLASTVFWLPQSYLTQMIINLGAVFFFLGISRIISGYRIKRISSQPRFLSMIIGVILMIISVPVMISNVLGGVYWILILAIGLMIFGLNILITGLISPGQISWFRMMEVFDGTALIVLGLVIALFSQLGAITLLFLLAFGIALAGIYLIIVGILGRQIFITN